MRYEFCLVVIAGSELTPEMADALYEATGGDIELGVVDGVMTIEFEREARSLRDAVRSAITQVEGTSLGLHVDRVESETANTIAQINHELAGGI